MKYIAIFLLLPFLSYSQNQKGVTPTASSHQQKVNNTYAVVIGISDYQDKDIPDLLFADKDAEAFANFLRSPAGGTLDADHLQVLTNTQATAGRIAEALDALIEKAKKDDQVIIYFSGHGDVEGKKLTQPGFLLCWDAPSRVYMGGGTYSLSFLQEVVSTLSVQNQAKVIVITDACHAGKLAGSQIGGAQLTTANLAKQYANEVKILSCQPNEFSLEGPQWGGGRGVFSYHLVDGLFGLADRNNDGQVTLGEIDRYLEDHVTTEAEPQSQVPILLGNKTDRMATVNANILSDLKKNKTRDMQVFASTDSRGFEDEILSRTDTSIQILYKAFKQAVAQKRFLFPENDCAEKYYGQLLQVEMLAPLKGIMKRNYAAALQDEAQFILNSLMRKGIDKALTNADDPSLSYLKFPKLLDRAAELLGKGHYFYNSLLARKYFFESYLVKSPESKMEKCRLALNLLNDFPLAYWRMACIQGWNVGSCDSTVFYLKKAIAAAPSWLRPYCDLGLYNCGENRDSTAELNFSKAYGIDSTSAVLWYNKGLYYSQISPQPGKAISNYEKALSAANSDGLCFPCIYVNLGELYRNKGDTMKALGLYLEGLKMDSLNPALLNNIGYIYKAMGQYDLSIFYLKKGLKLNEKNLLLWANLTHAYYFQKEYQLGEDACREAFKIDPNDAEISENYANILLATNQKELAIKNYKKSYYSFVKKYSLERAKTILGKLINLDSLNEETRQIKFDFENIYNNKNASISYGLTNLPFDSMNTKYWNYAGDGYREIKDYNRAIYYYNGSLSIDSTQLIVKTNRAFCYDALNQSEKAIKDLKQVLAVDSLSCTALNNLGRIYLYSGSFYQAEELFYRAIRCNPILANPYKHLGILHFKKGDFSLSKQYLLKAIELDPDYDLAYIGMAYPLIAENKIEEALHYIEMAIQHKADYKQLMDNPELNKLRALPAWNLLMTKYYSDQFKK